MSSIVLSFVGSQDPFGKETGEGSIVSLLRGLKDNEIVVSKAFLLFTEGTEKNAYDTKDWLASNSELQDINVELIPVSSELSYDPTDLLKAAQEAKRGLELVKKDLHQGDFVEFNASSGTPAMKSSFSMLQAAGYATNGRVWQVRNPREIREGQSRVFQTDVSSLRKEFDLQVLKQFISKYNYSAALDLLNNSDLTIEPEFKMLIQACCDWNQGEFKTFFDKVKPCLKSVKQKQQADIWWSRSYEQAFMAVVRYEQGNTTEAMFHSFRAIEGSLYEWAINTFSNDIEQRENKYPLVKESILESLPRLRARFNEEKNKNRYNKVRLQGWFLRDILEEAIPETKHNENFKVYWKSAREERNFIAHKLGGVTVAQLFNAWDVKHDIKNLENRLLSCLQFLTGQSLNLSNQLVFFHLFTI